LLGLKDALKKIEIKDQPKLSVKRLLDHIRANRNIAKLESKKRQLQAELAQIQADIQDAKGMLTSMRDTILKELNNAFTSMMSQIGLYSESVQSAVQELHSNNLKSIEETKQTSQNAIQGTSEYGKREIKELGKAVQYSMGTIWNDINKWGSVKEEIGKYEEWLTISYCLMGLIEKPEAMKILTVDVIKKLVEKIHEWVIYHLSEAEITPPPKVREREFHLTSYDKVELRSLSEWLLGDIRDRF